MHFDSGLRNSYACMVLILNACYVFMCVGLISSAVHGLGPQVCTIFFDWLSLYVC